MNIVIFLLSLQTIGFFPQPDGAILRVQDSTPWPTWSLTVNVNGSVDLVGDRREAIEGFWPTLSVGYANANCTSVIAMSGERDIRTHEDVATLVVNGTGWRVALDPHGVVSFQGNLPERTRSIWIDIGKELQRRCWVDPWVRH